MYLLLQAQKFETNNLQWHEIEIMQRQILESVTNPKMRNNFIMNNKAEYNRCALPRLTAKLGEKELSKWRAEDKEEMEKEATIEENIRMRHKEKSRKRG